MKSPYFFRRLRFLVRGWIHHYQHVVELPDKVGQFGELFPGQVLRTEFPAVQFAYQATWSV